MKTSWRRWVFFFLSATRWMTSVKGSHWHAVLPHVTQTHWSQGLCMQTRSHELNKPLLFKLVSMGHLVITKTHKSTFEQAVSHVSDVTLWLEMVLSFSVLALCGGCVPPRQTDGGAQCPCVFPWRHYCGQVLVWCLCYFFFLGCH